MDLRIFDPITALFSRSAKKTIKFEAIDHAVKEKISGYSDMERHQAILDTLHHLESQKKCKLPVQKKTGWNPLTALPRYVILKRPQQDAEKKLRKQEIAKIRDQTAWEPDRMASFAHALTTLKQLELAKVVNHYLLHRKTDEKTIPHRERALKVFGDEKALDPYMKTGLFSGRITFQNLDCFYCPEPFPYELYSLDPKDTQGYPLLLVENSATYWSCCQANRPDHPSGGGFFAAVIFGKGFKASNEYQVLKNLSQIEKQTKSKKILYFGDLDPVGLDIPKRINETRIKNERSPICPAIPLYSALLDKEVTTKYQKKQEQYHDPNWVKAWLGTQLAIRYIPSCHIKRWPQEGLTASDIGRAMVADIYASK